MKQQSIFDYPNYPGFKRRGTAERAARRMAPKVPSIKEKVLALLKIEPMTSYELAMALGDSRLRSVPPRVSELVTGGLVVDSGMIRLTGDEHEAIVWKLKK